ncbi:MAG TPA: hypothetical protein VN754_05170 [Candidatus Binataceae bacterium]|nr:hypothetical protein [Candidatus Binataceae bacterium]
MRADKENTRSELVTLEPGDFPRRLAGGQLPVIIAVGLEHKTAAPRHLRDGRVRADAPGQRFEPVLARRKLQLVGGVGPVLDIGPVGAARDAGAVQKQLKAFIGADVNADGRGGGFKLLAKAQQHRLPPAAGKNVAMRRRRGVAEVRMPNPRRLVNGLQRDDPGVAKMQARRQKNLADDGRIIFRRGSGQRQHGGKQAWKEFHMPFRHCHSSGVSN